MASTTNIPPKSLLDQPVPQLDESLTEEQRRERFMELLVESGMIRERKPAIRPVRERPPLIQVEGEPLSETIIRERR